MSRLIFPLFVLCGFYNNHAQGASPTMKAIAEAAPDKKLALVARFARIASDSYAALGAEKPLPAGLVLLADSPPASSSVTGFLARAYRDTTTDEIIISFAGTDWHRVGTLLTDVGLIAGTIPEQFVQAEAYVKAVHAKYPDRPIVLVGHSLGGALAIFVAQKGLFDAVAFNAPFLNDKLWEQVPGAHRQSFKNGPWYLNFQSTEALPNSTGLRRDLISSVRLWQQAAVEVIGLKVGCQADALCHSIDAFVVKDPAAPVR